MAARIFPPWTFPASTPFDTRSAEEELTKDFILNEDYDFLLVVCDATCLERGLYLLSQAAGAAGAQREAGPMPQAVLCVNLCDEAEKRGSGSIFKALSVPWGIPCDSLLRPDRPKAC